MASPARTGSQMSSKQIAYAVLAGKRLTFRIPTVGVVEGYVIGMDDYHWFVAHVEDDNTSGDNDSLVETTLLHKGSVAAINISRKPALASEAHHIRVAVEELGRAFVAWCEKTYNKAPQGADA